MVDDALDISLAEMIEEAERDGLESFAAGEELSANPFTAGPLREAWARSWKEAARHHAA